MSVKIITRYDYAERAKIAPGIFFDPKKDKSLTNQSDLEGSNINNIMARYEKTGFVPGTDRAPQYGDFSEVGDYHSLQIKIKNAERAFEQLPASVRARFDNDPGKLVNFVADPANLKEVVKLGLLPETALLTKIDPDRPGVKISEDIYNEIIGLDAAARKKRQDEIAAQAANQAPTA